MKEQVKSASFCTLTANGNCICWGDWVEREREREKEKATRFCPKGQTVRFVIFAVVPSSEDFLESERGRSVKQTSWHRAEISDWPRRKIENMPVKADRLKGGLSRSEGEQKEEHCPLNSCLHFMWANFDVCSASSFCLEFSESER